MKLSRLINIIAVASMLLTALGFSYSPVVAQGDEPPLSEQAYVPGEVVVGFTSGSSSADFALQATALASQVNADVTRQQGGLVLLSFDPGVDVNALVSEIQVHPGVSFAEPNYIYTLPKDVTTSPEVRASANEFHQNYILRRPSTTVNLGVNPKTDSSGRTINLPGAESDHAMQAVPIAKLQAMKTVGPNNTIRATYPNDPYTWWGGYGIIDAEIVWPNVTPSAGICEIDTGVDYLHPDLAVNIIKGYDFVNNDANPMDDHGHGTHVAGVMVAAKNNAKGLAGVSTGKVVAVKALDAQGSGTNLDIAAAINFCAARTDVRVISMSLGGGYSQAIEIAVANAVNVKNKLIVAAAGNDSTNNPIYSYPAAFSVSYPNKVISVAASGQWYEYDGNWYIDYGCRAEYSNYGNWVNVVAPGTSIYSTLPYDKPFYMNSFYPWRDTRYDYLDGTSMATPYVAAAAARRWGYKPARTNDQVGSDVINNSSWQMWDPGDESCWPASMVGKSMVSVATLLDRGAVYGFAYDASSGNPLTGATLQVYRDLPGTDPLIGSAIIVPSTWRASPDSVDPTRIYTYFNDYAEVINLPIEVYVPIWGDYSFSYSKINKAGFTVGAQITGWGTRIDGEWSYIGDANVPPKSANFDVVSQWMGWNYTTNDVPDLDTNVWLPDMNGSGALSGIPTNFLVGPQGTLWNEHEPLGGMTYFPYARMKREGGWSDWLRVENITIRNRNVAHDGLAANAALPFYRGTYTVVMTDYGQVSSGVPLLGGDTFPYVYIWKDGLLKWQSFNDCNGSYWKAVRITSGNAGAVTYNNPNACSGVMFNPE